MNEKIFSPVLGETRYDSFGDEILSGLEFEDRLEKPEDEAHVINMQPSVSTIAPFNEGG
jgi:hypothetical protein